MKAFSHNFLLTRIKSNFGIFKSPCPAKNNPKQSAEINRNQEITKSFQLEKDLGLQLNLLLRIKFIQYYFINI